MADVKDPVKALQELKELKKSADHYAAGLQNKLEEMANLLDGIPGKRVESIMVYVNGCLATHKETRARLNGNRGLGRRMEMWQAALEDLGHNVG
jgi:hypothetical protein